jgi:hypothetical protein
MSLSVKGLNVSYGKNHILKDINLEIESGEFVSILGKSGCGKTTLIKSIAGLLETDNGDINIFDKNVATLLPEKRQTVIVFQDLRLFPHMNVEDNIAFAMKLKKMDKAVIKEKVEKLLDQVRLSGYEKRKVSRLSGGQMQRVALARALGAEPKLLLLDEPFASLDEDLRKEMGELVRRLHRENGITTVMITHDKEEAMELSDRLALMEEGRILAFDSPERLYNSPKDIKTAAMLGDVNFFKGQVDGSTFISDIISFNTDKKAGEYKLLLRPSELTVDKWGEMGIKVRLKQTSFRGEITELVLEAGDHEYKVRLPHGEYIGLDIKNGDEVRLISRKNNDFILLEEA